MKIAVMEHGFRLEKGSMHASAFDIKTPVDFAVVKGKPVKIGLGIRSEIPHGVAAIIAPRSGLGSKGIRICNTIGIIDTDYRGEWQASLVLEDWAEVNSMLFERGDRVLQVVLAETLTHVAHVSEDVLTDTERGDGGYGSTGVA